MTALRRAGGRRRGRFLLCHRAVIGGLGLLLATATGLAARATDPLPELRRLYRVAVDDAAMIGPALALIDEATGAAVHEDTVAVLAAYAGALETLRAKHGNWPPTRLRRMRRGLALLDSVVAARPTLAEPRYLRLMSCYSLPPLFGRSASVRADFDALARLLPGEPGTLTPPLRDSIALFVLAHGEPDEVGRRALERLLVSPPD